MILPNFAATIMFPTFLRDAINLTCSHQERIIADGLMPVDEPLVPESCKELR